MNKNEEEKKFTQIERMDMPCIVDETEDFAVVFKPPRMHCINKNLKYNREQDEQKKINDEDADTLFYWCKKHIGAAEYLQLMHRLDYETHGLVLFAKNKNSFEFFKNLQDKGQFIKEYSAICSNIENKFELLSSLSSINYSLLPAVIESYFRPYGPGRKSVRPVIDDQKKRKETAKDKGSFYKTEIVSRNENIFTLRIKRGFRHQIRCHLCWIGYPILNDPLYPELKEQKETLALRSHALYFIDPSSSKNIEYRIESLS